MIFSGSLHVVTTGSISHFLTPEGYSLGYKHHISSSSPERAFHLLVDWVFYKYAQYYEQEVQRAPETQSPGGGKVWFWPLGSSHGNQSRQTGPRFLLPLQDTV